MIGPNLDLAETAMSYNPADYYVSPYWAEDFNFLPFEAASCGTAIVVTAGGATDEYMHSSFGNTIQAKLISTQTGNFLVPDLDNLVQTLEQSCSDTKKKLSSECENPISRNFTL